MRLVYRDKMSQFLSFITQCQSVSSNEEVEIHMTEAEFVSILHNPKAQTMFENYFSERAQNVARLQHEVFALTERQRTETSRIEERTAIHNQISDAETELAKWQSHRLAPRPFKVNEFITICISMYA